MTFDESMASASALFTKLMVDRQAVLLPLEQLDYAAARVDEYEDAAIGDFSPQVFPDNTAESVEALSEVHDSLVPVVPRIRIKMKHGKPLSSWRTKTIVSSETGNRATRPLGPVTVISWVEVAIEGTASTRIGRKRGLQSLGHPVPIMELVGVDTGPLTVRSLGKGPDFQRATWPSIFSR
jgi:hypothetical protein